MPEETTKLSGGGGSPALSARPLDHGKRQLIIAPRRGAAPWAAAPRSVAGAALRSTLSQIPGLDVVRVLPARHTPSAGAVPSDPASETYVVRIDPERAEWLKQTLLPQFIVEEDAPLEYGTPAGLPRPAPARLTAWCAPGPLETRPIRFRVLGEADKPVPSAGVSLTGEGFPQESRTDKRGEVTVPLTALPGRRPRSVLVTAPSGHWELFLSDPELSEGDVNVVRLRAIDETISGFPERFRYGWGQVQMGLDRLPETFTCKGVSMALVDSGVDSTHPLLRHVRLGADLTNGADPQTWTQDVVGHGSHCAGILAARDESGRMLRGFAPDAEIHALKVFPGGQVSNLLEALDYCLERGVDIVNLSLGSARPSAAVEQRLEDLARHGIACIAAAGNSGGPVQYPASSPYTLAIGAVGRLDAYPDRTWEGTTVVPELVAPDGVFSPSFSAVGPEVAVCAPGVAILSTVPGGFEPLSGTSIAAPHVAGLAAVLLAHHPLFQGPLRARGPQRVAALFQMIRSLCVPYAFAGRAGAGLPRLHGLEDVLRASASANGHATASPGNGRASAAAPLGSAMGAAVPSAVTSAAMSGLPRPLAGVVGTPVFGAAAPSAGPFVDTWYAGPVYVAVPLAAQEWPFHALLESLRQQSGGA
jgi:subtilisin